MVRRVFCPSLEHRDDSGHMGPIGSSFANVSMLQFSFFSYLPYPTRLPSVSVILACAAKRALSLSLSRGGRASREALSVAVGVCPRGNVAAADCDHGDCNQTASIGYRLLACVRYRPSPHSSSRPHDRGLFPQIVQIYDPSRQPCPSGPLTRPVTGPPQTASSPPCLRGALRCSKNKFGDGSGVRNNDPPERCCSNGLYLQRRSSSL